MNPMRSFWRLTPFARARFVFIPASLLLTCCLPAIALAKPLPVYRWTTLAGRSGIGAEDGLRADARFNNPHGLAYDLAGNLYVADTGNHTIRKIAPDGQVTTFAGKAGQPGTADGTGAAARFNFPQGIAADRNGNMYVADTGNHTIRLITTTGIVSTLAGRPGQSGTADGSASAALFDAPDRLSVDAAGTVYLNNHGVRRIAAGVVSTLTIPATTTDADGRVLTVKADQCPAVDSQGFLYFPTEAKTETFSHARAGQFLKRAPDGTFSVVRNSDFSPAILGGTYSYRNIGDSISNDVAGHLFIVQEIRASTLLIQFRGKSMLPDGTLNQDQVAVFQSYLGAPRPPLAVAQTPTGEWLYTYPSEHAVKTGQNAAALLFSDDALKATQSAYAGTATAEGHDAVGHAARFESASVLAVAPTGEVWVAETVQRYFRPSGANSFSLESRTRVRQIATSGAVTTPEQSWYPPGEWRRSINSYYQQPTGLHADGTGTITLARLASSLDQTYVLNQFFPNGTITAMNAPSGFIGDPIITHNGRLYVLNYDGRGFSNSNYYTIKRREADGAWTTLAGGPSFEILDGVGSTARFKLPTDLTEDHNGNAYLLDVNASGNTVIDTSIRRIAADGTVTTIGPKFTNNPTGLAVDPAGNFYLTHLASHTITRRDAAGDEVIIGGTKDWANSADGDGSAAGFAAPEKITIDLQGNLYVIDGYGTTVRKGEYLGFAPDITTQPQSQTVAAGATVNFSVTATSTPAPTYQWQFNGTSIAGATDSTLNIANARTADAGSYTVIVSNSLASVTSNIATLAVTTTTTPPPSGGTNSGGGGGGAPSAWFLSALLALGLGRRFLRSRPVVQS